MNKKIVCVILFMLLLGALSLAVFKFVKAVSTDPIHFSDGVTLLSPVNATYNSNYLTMNYTFACGWVNYVLNYSIDDGKYGGPMPYTIINPQELHVVYSSTGSVQLPKLSEGSHSLTVSLEADFNDHDIRYYSDTIYFTINTGASDSQANTTLPTITIQSPQNNTAYPANTRIPFSFTVSEPTSSIIYILLDSNRTAMPPQNTTLPQLMAGQHNITLIAIDTTGNSGISQSVQFAVTNPTPTPTPPFAAPQISSQLLILVVVLFVVVVGCCIGAFVYFKKKK